MITMTTGQGLSVSDSDDPKPDELIPRQVVCVGYRIGIHSDVVVGFVPRGNVDAEPSYFKAKGLRKLVIGGVYTLPANADFTRIKIAPIYVEIYHDTAKRIAWQVASTAAKTAHALTLKENADGRRDELVDLLTNIRKEYYRSNSTERMAIELALLRALRYGA